MAERSRFPRFVGHVERRHTALLDQSADEDEQLASETHVQVRERLVEEHGLRIEDQRPRDRDPLAFTAGEVGRPTVFFPGETYPPSHIRNPRLANCARHSSRLESEGEIPGDREMRPQGELLQHDGKISFLGQLKDPTVGTRHRAVEPNTPALRSNEAEDQPHDGRLAGSRGAEERQDLAGLQREREAREHRRGAQFEPHVLQADHRGHARCARRSSVAPTATMVAVSATCTTASAATTLSGPFASSVKIRTGKGSRPGG